MCGGKLVLPDGKIRSPRVPISPPHPIECYWNVRVSRAKIMNVSVFVAWKKNEKCSNYLHIQYRTEDRESTLKICGKEDLNGNFLLRTNSLWIKYHVEVSKNTSEMKAVYTITFQVISFSQRPI